MSIVKVAYGTENGNDWFVQTCCNEEHYGNDCNCKSYGEKFTEIEAEKIANDLAEIHHVSVEKW